MAFRFDKLTVKAQEAVQRAHELAQQNGQIDSLHVLSALLSESEGIVGPLLDKMGVNRPQLDGMVESEIARLPKVLWDRRSRDKLSVE